MVVALNQVHDDPDVLWIEGTNYSLCRPDWCSRAAWAALGVDWKLKMLSLIHEAVATAFGGSE